MAMFLGPQFLLLVLAGLMLCDDASNSTTQTSPPNIVTSNPSSTQDSTVTNSPTQTSSSLAVIAASNSSSSKGKALPNSPTQPATSPAVTTSSNSSSSKDPAVTNSSTQTSSSLAVTTASNSSSSKDNETTQATTVTETYSSSAGTPASTKIHQQQTISPSNQTVTGNTISGSPPLTSESPEIFTTGKAGIPASTSMQQTNTSLNTTDKSNTTISRISPTSPTRTPPTTVKPITCEYALKKENYTVKVNIWNVTATTVTFSSSTGHEIKRSAPYPSIPFKSFQPCQTYTVSFDPPCNPKDKKDEVFETNLPNVTRTNITDEPHVQVCFETQWNWTECVNINRTNSCKSTNYTLKSEKAGCEIIQPITYPPEKPRIGFENKYPTTLSWENPNGCTGSLKYFCNGSAVDDIKTLEPVDNHNCTGIYYYENISITSELLTVNIKCNINDPNITNISENKIDVLWTVTSDNCQNITKDITWNAMCFVKERKAQIHSFSSFHSTKLSQETLLSYTDYQCDFEAKYHNKIIKTYTETVKTLPSKPSKPTVTIEPLGQNGLRVTCEVDNWNGKKGNYTMMLIDHPEQQTKDSCHFEFKDLYYLKTYTVEVFATNKQGNFSATFSKKYSTKYNDKAVLGFLGFLIVLTSLALLFVLYKIYLLKREKSRDGQELDDLLPANSLLPVEPINADALLEVYKRKRADEGRLFMEEFQSIPRIFSQFTVREAKHSDNQSKNRYVDILPYDYNRVTLSHRGTDDYINASFIEGHKEKDKYIAAQGPKEETIGDFWTMIWEQKTSIIVMVTRCEEGNKSKCAQYWPSLERETEIFDGFVVKITSEENCPDYIIRHLTLLNQKEKNTERVVTHIQFTSWPDHGVPADPGLLLKLRRRVNSFKNFFSGPIVIHCSAGVGRTGTYICIDAMIESLDSEGRVDIYGYVAKLRRQRCLMVQVEAQYVLIHTALIEYSQYGDTEILLSDFHSEVNTLKQKAENQSLMELEFQKLPELKNYRLSKIAHAEENTEKNRSCVVPYDFNRVAIKIEDDSSHDSDADDEDEYSSDEEDETPTKYINASYVDGYWSPSSFIVAQGPMPDTVGDFLQMLYQKRVKKVFMLTNCTENDEEFCSQYWDDEKKTFGEMVVEVKETENTPTYIRRCLEIQHTKRKDTHTLQQYHFLKWVGQELPANPLDLVDMMKTVRQSSGNSKTKILPIAVHCQDGSSRSGTFCALWKLLDSADTEKLVDIFQVAKDLRKARLGMLKTFKQYEFLYAALEAAYPVQNGEVKKPSEAPVDTVQVIDESTALISPKTDDTPKEGQEESKVSESPEESATEASSEPEKGPSESTVNGLTAPVEV